MGLPLANTRCCAVSPTGAHARKEGEGDDSNEDDDALGTGARRSARELALDSSADRLGEGCSILTGDRRSDRAPARRALHRPELAKLAERYFTADDVATIEAGPPFAMPRR